MAQVNEPAQPGHRRRPRARARARGRARSRVDTLVWLPLRAARLADARRVGAGEVGGPVHLPGAAVVGEGLLPAGVIGVELGPGIAHGHRAAGVLVLAVELAALSAKAADDGRVEGAGLAAHPVDRPLAPGDVEGTHRQAGPALGR